MWRRNTSGGCVTLFPGRSGGERLPEVSEAWGETQSDAQRLEGRTLTHFQPPIGTEELVSLTTQSPGPADRPGTAPGPLMIGQSNQISTFTVMSCVTSSKTSPGRLMIHYKVVCFNCYLFYCRTFFNSFEDVMRHCGKCSESLLCLICCLFSNKVVIFQFVVRSSHKRKSSCQTRDCENRQTGVVTRWPAPHNVYL